MVDQAVVLQQLVVDPPESYHAIAIMHKSSVSLDV